MFIIYFFIAILLIFISVLLYIYNLAFYNPPSKRIKKHFRARGEQYDAVREKLDATTKTVSEAEFQPVEIIAQDGVKLRGKYYHYADGAPMDIIFHGYRSRANHDCGGGYLLARDLGHNVILPDQRAHGESGSNTITFGIKERYDCLEWIKFACTMQPDVKIVISGVSMGAATVLMASELDLPENVKGIIADCAFSSPIEIILMESEKMGIPKQLAKPFIKLSARLMGGFNVEEASAREAVKNAKVPILLVHGEDDKFVPCRMSYDIYENCTGDKKLITFEGAGHGLSFLVDAERYKKEINEFKNRVNNN
ncbi:MAG: alpha/beta hydrolase [Clostridia bacterium]|nr:alpha/beta hydrolase [Clostridia bacterium]